MIKPILISTIAIFINLVIYGQTPNPSTPILSKSDVEQFIKSYPDILQEFETADIDYNVKGNIENLTNAYSEVDEINSIVQKHNYQNYTDFATKSWAIASCYASIKIEQEGMPSIQSAIDDIQANENLTAEQKELSIQQLKQIFETLSNSVNDMSNAQDIETVSGFIDELDSILE